METSVQRTVFGPQSVHCIETFHYKLQCSMIWNSCILALYMAAVKLLLIGHFNLKCSHFHEQDTIALSICSLSHYHVYIYKLQNKDTSSSIFTTAYCGTKGVLIREVSLNQSLKSHRSIAILKCLKKIPLSISNCNSCFSVSQYRLWGMIRERKARKSLLFGNKVKTSYHTASRVQRVY